MIMNGRYQACLWLALALGAFGLGGCGRKPEATGGAGNAGSEPLVRVNDRALTEVDFRFEVNRRLAAGQPVGDVGSIITNLMEREVLLQEARRSDVMNDPEVRRELDNQILARWLARTLQVEKERVTVSDEDLKQIYSERLAEFTTSALVRLAILYRAAAPPVSAETLASLTAELEKARQRYLGDPVSARQGGRLQGFGTVAAEYSEDGTSRYRGGDLGWMKLDRRDDQWPAEVLAAGMALELDHITDVLTTDRGLFVVMKTGVRQADVTPFDQVAASLRRRIIRERQEGMSEAFIARLVQGSRIAINSEKVAGLSIPAPSAVASAGGPPNLKTVSEYSSTSGVQAPE